MKFLLDQTVGSVMNIVLFIVLINLLKGMSWATVYRLTCEVRITDYLGSLCALLTDVGLWSDYDRTAQVSAACIRPNVHGRAGRSTSGVWERLRRRMGRLPQPLCGCLIAIIRV